MTLTRRSWPADVDLSVRHRMRSAHASRHDTCLCGRNIFGNGAKSHYRACPAYLAMYGWPLEKDLATMIAAEHGHDGLVAGQKAIATAIIADGELPSWIARRDLAWNAARARSLNTGCAPAWVVAKSAACAGDPVPTNSSRAPSAANSTSRPRNCAARSRQNSQPKWRRNTTTVACAPNCSRSVVGAPAAVSSGTSSRAAAAIGIGGIMRVPTRSCEAAPRTQ